MQGVVCSNGVVCNGKSLEGRKIQDLRVCINREGCNGVNGRERELPDVG